MKALEKVKRILSLHKQELKEKYKIKEIDIFGSYVRREQNENSDIDLLVEFEKIPDLLTFIEIESHLETLLKKKVDLVRKQVIRPELREFILNEAIPV